MLLLPPSTGALGRRPHQAAWPWWDAHKHTQAPQHGGFPASCNACMAEMAFFQAAIRDKEKLGWVAVGKELGWAAAGLQAGEPISATAGVCQCQGTSWAT